ncbi:MULTISPECIES: CocE/NonD family hydrolase [Synechococcales]|uniref:CocE/NonD family hydrolase n=1 Tax=Synechococcus sp. CS-1324 TaxID=2847980 RepID=UPI0026B4337E|nr:CocE/NonD family hydrolase [Synechococcus sp. CS-1324]
MVPPLSVEVLDTWMPCPDGVRLATRIWKPGGAGRWPVLLLRQPYGRRIASTVTSAHPHWYAREGYVVAVQDVRGRGDSGGDFGGFAQEARDGATALAWARSQSWSNGRLGTYGFSYQGLTQLLSDNPDLTPDCLVPAMTGLDERLHWASDGGAHRWALGLAWALQLAAETVRRQGDELAWTTIRRSLQSGHFLADGLELLRRHDPAGMGLGWLGLDPGSAEGWCIHQPSVALLRRPMLLVGGWWDAQLGGVLDLHHRSLQAGGDPLLRIGAWSHLDWDGGLDRLQLLFFDQHLRDRPAALPPARQRLADLGSGLWSDAAGAGIPSVPWRLASDGLAAIDHREGRLLGPEDDDAGGGEVWLVHDPWRPAPGRGGHLGLDAGPVERGDLDRRSDVACFTTAPLPRALRLQGQLQLELEVAADQPGFDLCAALSIVRGQGEQVLQISTAVGRFLGPDCLRGQRRRILFQPLLASLRTGEQLRLSVAAAAWPQIAVNPGTGAIPLGPAGPEHRVISLQLLLPGASLGLLPGSSARLD